ncbi:MAG: polysaccharide deacetylase family protein [Candidatus Bathyarchaeota archaeon]|jgi:peptidoglycan/xylan/chitin deacetylase (PgdA/CDA1 family)
MTVHLILSFDDASGHNVKASSLLEKHDLKACFYLDTDRMSREMDEEDVRGISQRNEIGGHGVTHRDLVRLEPEEAAWEIFECKKRLEDLIDKPVRSFAYPFGSYDAEIKTILPTADYTSGRTTEPYNTSIGRDLYQIGVTSWGSPHPYRKIFHAMKFLSPSRLLLEPTLIKRWDKFTEMILNKMMDRGSGVLHLLLHAPFIEERSEWPRLENLLEIFSTLKDNLENPTITRYLESIRIGDLQIRDP